MADETPVNDTTNTDAPDESAKDEALGEGGKKALAAERKRADDNEKLRKEMEARVKAYEDRDKTDAEKQAETLASMTERAEKAEATLARLEVAMEKGLTPEQARRLVGKTKDELSADADDLMKAFNGGGSKDEDTTGKRPAKEDLRPGSSPTGPQADDPAAVAKRLFGEGRI